MRDDPPWTCPAAADAAGGGETRRRLGQTMGNCGTAKLWELRQIKCRLHKYDAFEHGWAEKRDLTNAAFA